MPMNAFVNASYFTLRSGGKTVITFFFDCGYVWVVSIPLAYCLSRFTETFRSSHFTLSARVRIF